jgi:hypothetical protein
MLHDLTDKCVFTSAAILSVASIVCDITGHTLKGLTFPKGHLDVLSVISLATGLLHSFPTVIYHTHV